MKVDFSGQRDVLGLCICGEEQLMMELQGEVENCNGGSLIAICCRQLVR